MARSPHSQRLDRAPGMPADPREIAAARWRAVQAMLCDPELDHSAARLGCLIVVKFMNGDSGWAWPSFATLAGAAGISRSTVIRAIKTLGDRGHVLTVAGGGRRTGSSGAGLSNRYTVDWKRLLSGGVSPVTPFETTAGDDAATVSLVSDKGVTCEQVTVSSTTPEHPLSNLPLNVADCAGAREADDGEGDHAADDAAARRVNQEVSQRTVDPLPANDDPGPTLSEVEERRQYHRTMTRRFGAWEWWSGRGLATPLPDEAVAANREFAEAVHAFDRGASAWTIRQVDGARFVDRSAGTRPTHAEVTAFAEALAAGEAEAVDLLPHFATVAEVEVEVEARHLAARLEARAVGDDDLVLALFAEEPELRLAAEARAAALAASWEHRIAAEPVKLAALPPAANMSNAELIEAARIVCDVRGWDAGDLARAVGLPAHALEAFLQGGHQRINPAGHARLRPWIAERQSARAAA